MGETGRGQVDSAEALQQLANFGYRVGDLLDEVPQAVLRFDLFATVLIAASSCVPTWPIITGEADPRFIFSACVPLAAALLPLARYRWLRRYSVRVVDEGLFIRGRDDSTLVQWADLIAMRFGFGTLVITYRGHDRRHVRLVRPRRSWVGIRTGVAHFDRAKQATDPVGPYRS